MTTVRAFASESPSTTVVNDTGQVNLGMEFYVLAPAWVTHIWWFQPSTGGETPSTAPRTVGIWLNTDASTGNTGSLVGSTVTQAPVGSGWQQVALPTPIALDQFPRYRVTVYHPEGKYNALATYFNSGSGQPGSVDQTFGGLLVVPNTDHTVGTDQGSFNYSSSFAYPLDSFNDTNYWVDVTVTDVNPAAYPFELLTPSPRFI